MHHNRTSGPVRVRVGFGRAPVRRPTRVADSHLAADRLVAKKILQSLQLPFRAPDGNLTLIENGNAGRVVASIFQLLQTLQNYRSGLSLADVSDYAAHRPRPREAWSSELGISPNPNAKRGTRKSFSLPFVAETLHPSRDIFFCVRLGASAPAGTAWGMVGSEPI